MKRLGFDLILLGDPAAGKDTEAAILRKIYLLKPVESGKYWRLLAKKKNAEGQKLRATMSIGLPTPVVLMKKFLMDNLRHPPKNKDLIFVGNPRLKPEAQLLVKLMKQKNRDFIVLYLKIPTNVILKRTKKRSRSRSEDEGVWNRINYTKNQVSKTVAYFKSLGKLKFINSTASIIKVHNEVEKILNDYSRLARS